MKIILLFILVIVLSGCYPHIRWAEEDGVLYHVRAVEGLDYKGIYEGKVFGVHRIAIRKGWEDSKYILNHELCHARGFECHE